MGFFGDLGKKLEGREYFIDDPDMEWRIIEDTPLRKVWQNSEFNTIEMNAMVDTNGIPKKKDGEIYYKAIGIYGNKWVGIGYGTYDSLIDSIENFKSRFNSNMMRARIKKKTHLKIKRKPVKKIISRCKCKKK